MTPVTQQQQSSLQQKEAQAKAVHSISVHYGQLSPVLLSAAVKTAAGLRHPALPELPAVPDHEPVMKGKDVGPRRSYEHCLTAVHQKQTPKSILFVSILSVTSSYMTQVCSLGTVESNDRTCWASVMVSVASRQAGGLNKSVVVVKTTRQMRFTWAMFSGRACAVDTENREPEGRGGGGGGGDCSMYHKTYSVC